MSLIPVMFTSLLLQSSGSLHSNDDLMLKETFLIIINVKKVVLLNILIQTMTQFKTL